MKDFYQREVVLPKVGDRVLRDGCEFCVSEVIPHRDIGIIATITLRGAGAIVETGYYDYLLHKKVEKRK